MKKLGPLLMVALFGISAAVWAQQKGSALKVAIVTEDKYAREERTAFSPETPAIYAAYRIVAAGPVTLKIAFWADSVEAFAANSKLFERSVPFSSSGEFMGTVSAQRPGGGWPAGTYRVEFTLGENPTKSVSFRVPKRPGAS